MRVLFTSLALPGHYFPLVPLGWALRAAGHEVRVAVEPAYADAVASSGLHAVAVGGDVDLGATWRAAGTRRENMTEQDRHETGTRMMVAVAESVLPGTLSFAEAWRPDLVVYEPVAYAGPVVAGRIGVPAVRHLWGPDSPYLVRRFAEPILDRFGREHGLEGLAHLGELTVDPCPPAMQYDVDYPVRTMRYVPYNGPGTVPDWTVPDGTVKPPARRRVLVTWGTSFVKSTGHMRPLHQAVEALSDQDAEIVVAISASQRETVGDLPAGVRVAESVPLQLLLPGCDLIIHQGGAGTTMTPAALGVPQLVIPARALADEPMNAERLAATGAGLTIELGEADTASMREAITRLLGEPSFARAAADLRAEIQAQPSPADIVADLEKLGGAR